MSIRLLLALSFALCTVEVIVNQHTSVPARFVILCINNILLSVILGQLLPWQIQSIFFALSHLSSIILHC